MIADAALDQIAERLALWIEQRDLDSLRDGDLRDLLAELREMRRQHKHDVALLTSCRQRYADLDTEYRALSARIANGSAEPGDRPEDHWRDARAEALDRQSAVEVGEAP